eukprot:6171866-Pleurochrysis_carterae.AAC.1
MNESVVGDVRSSHHRGRVEDASDELEGEENRLNKKEGLRERRRHQVFKWNRHLYHARRYTGGKGKKEGFWTRREIRQDYILNRIVWNERKARRARVTEIFEEQRARAEELLRRIRREASISDNTDELIQSLMQLGKGTWNV